MNITDYITITELARLTNKSRPSIYKYVLSFENNNLDEIPYSIINLFKLILDNKSKQEIIDYCLNNFGNNTDNSMLEVINLLKDNREILDFEKIKKIIEEEINNG